MPLILDDNLRNVEVLAVLLNSHAHLGGLLLLGRRLRLLPHFIDILLFGFLFELGKLEDIGRSKNAAKLWKVEVSVFVDVEEHIERIDHMFRDRVQVECQKACLELIAADGAGTVAVQRLEGALQSGKSEKKGAGIA